MGGCRVGWDAAAEMAINWLSVTFTVKEKRGGRKGGREERKKTPGNKAPQASLAGADEVGHFKNQSTTLFFWWGGSEVAAAHGPLCALQ